MAKRRNSKSTLVMSLIFDKRVFNTREAKAWAKKHGYISKKVDRTENTIRLRQYMPKYFVWSGIRTIHMAAGVTATIGKLKRGYELR